MSSSDGIGGSDRLGELDTQLVAVEEEVRRVPTREHVDNVERRAGRGVKIAVVSALLIAMLSVAFSAWNTWRIADNTAKSAITAEGLESLKAANEKLQQEGLDPIPLPREGEAIDADALATAAAALAYNQMKDDPLFRGADGRDGPQGAPGAPCTPQVPGCAGQDGKPGSDGARGQDGAPPSFSDIQAAVNAYCSSPGSPCDGREPTQSQVQAAVDAYCDDRGCRGEDGTDGTNGDPGSVITGISVTGPNGNGVCRVHVDTSVHGRFSSNTFPCHQAIVDIN